VQLEREDAARAQPVFPGPSERVRGKVLLVDDSRDHQRLIGHLLARAGAEVTTAENGDVALHLLASTPFDLVLLDMQMPGKDGYATVAELRASGATTPVLALTADSAATDVERCLAAGCNGHLAKPVAPDVLAQALSMHLRSAGA
jgi:CheY-like chemotaxis protein